MTHLLTFLKRSILNVDGVLLQRLAGDHLNASHAGGRTLNQHLRGTQRILAAWGQSTILQRAGLCHSLYSTDAFEQRSVSLSNRDLVRKAIGQESEELVFLFCAIQRAPFFRSVLRADSLRPSVAIPIQVRQSFHALEPTVSGTQARDLLILHLANFAEQAGGRNEGPTLWLEQFQRLVQVLEDKAPDSVPTVLKHLRDIDHYAERQALTTYIRAIRLSANAEVAISLMEEVARLLPLVADPHVWLSWLWSQRGDNFRRRQHGRLAKEKLFAFGAAWDQRLPFDDWLALAQMGLKIRLPSGGFDRLRDFITSDEPSKESSKDLTARVNLETPALNAVSRLETYLLDVGEVKSKEVSGFYPGLRTDSFWNPEVFRLTSALQREFASIKDEINVLDAQDFHDESERIERTGKWQVFMLLEAGRWQEENLKRLPTLSHILKASNELRLAGGLVYLSRLGPGTIVAPHTGPTNMRLRLHFAIRVPEGDCAMRVDGSEHSWIEGQSVVFNDFLKHEVWNRTGEERLILLVDIWHPDITLPERKMLEAIHWMAQEHGHGLLEYWRKNDIARERSKVGQPIQMQDIDNLVL
jgi:hypothetical protein